MPFLHVTTRIEGRKDDDLLERKAGRAAFPAILILDAEGEPLLELDRALLSGALSTGTLTPASLGRKVEACESYLKLRARLAGGDKTAEVDLAVRSLEIGRIDLAEFGRAIAGRELTPEEEKAVARGRANAICESQVAAMRSSGEAAESVETATREFVKLYGAGTHPDSDSADLYWWVIATHAKATADASMIERSLEGLEATGGRARFGPLLDELKAELKALRASSG